MASLAWRYRFPDLWFLSSYWQSELLLASLNSWDVGFGVGFWHEHVIVVDSVVVDEDWRLALLRAILIDEELWWQAEILDTVSIPWISALDNWSVLLLNHGSEGDVVTP